MAPGEKAAANLWSHLRPEEIEHLRELARAEEEAEADVRRIAAKAEEVERTLTALSARRYSNILNAAARALGESSEPAAARAAPVDRGDLEEQLAGLRVRVTEAEDRLRRQRGGLRAKLVALVHTIARERLAPRYVELADGLVEMFATLSSAEELMLSLVASTGDYGKVHHVADHLSWGKLYLPGSNDLPAIAKRSHEEWNLPVVFSGEDALQRGVGQAALARFKESVTAAIGCWPLN
jgi:hypothetical protein